MIAKLLLLAAFFQFTVPFHTGATASSGGGGKTQIYTESFAYASTSDLQEDAPTLWQCNVAGGRLEVKTAGNLYSWNVSGGGDAASTYPSVCQWIGPGTINTNQYATATFVTLGSVNLGPAVRVSGTSWYGGYCQTTICGINKMVGATHSFNVATCSKTPVAGDVIELDATGTSPTVLTLYFNGVSCTTYTDSGSPLTTGTTGIANDYGSANAGNTSLSNVTGGNL